MSALRVRSGRSHLARRIGSFGCVRRLADAVICSRGPEKQIGSNPAKERRIVAWPVGRFP